MSDQNKEFLTPISHNTLQEQVYLRIRRGLVDGEFTPGQTLTIRGLASQLGTSVMPVREALQKLVVERVLDLLPTRSTRVPLLSANVFSEICEVRILLEGHAAALASEKATPSDMRAMEDAFNAFEDSSVGDDYSLIQQRNRAFHFSIYQAAHQVTLMELIEPLWVRCGPCTLTFFQSLGSTLVKRGASGRHRDALDAIRTHHPADARAAIVDDIVATRDRYRAHNPTTNEIKSKTGVAD